MGGTIEVDSELGVGSTFWFNINLPIEGTVKPVQKTPVDIAGARVLIIDDNAVNRSILAEQMDAWSFEHADFESGRDGLNFLHKAIGHGHKIDLVILDYQMPEMSGSDVLREMREDPLIAKIPVVLLSSVDDATTRSSLGNLQLEANLTRPARSSVLLETMGRMISEARRREPAGEPLSFAELLQQQKDAKTKVGFAGEASVDPQDLGNSTEPLSLETIASEGASREQTEILVAEDNEVNQMLFTQILESTNHTFKIVDNRLDAVAHWKTQKPSLILMDISMPKMNGYEATQAIRSAEAESEDHTPIDCRCYGPCPVW